MPELRYPTSVIPVKNATSATMLAQHWLSTPKRVQEINPG